MLNINSEKLFRQRRFDLIAVLTFLVILPDLPLSGKLLETFKDLQSFLSL